MVITFKGEYAVGYWTEGRVDVERINGRHPLRFDSVLGTDFTFDVGDGLHVLIEYFFSTREPQFTQEEVLKGDRTLHQFGVCLISRWGQISRGRCSDSSMVGMAAFKSYRRWNTL